MAGVKGRSGGRNARSRSFHVLQGTFRSDRHEGAEFIDPPKGAPEIPKGLSATAKAEWDRMVGRLEQAGTLSTVDDGALYQYVQLFAETETILEDHHQLRKLVKELKQAILKKLDGEAMVEAIGKIAELQKLAHKQTQQLRQGHMALRQWMVEFGMTPAARNRVKAPKGTATPANPLNRFIKTHA